MHLGIASHELRLDTSLAQISAHGEVGDSGHHGDRGGDVVEDTVSARDGVGHAHEDEGGGEHHSADGLAAVSLQPCGMRMKKATYEIPVRATSGDGNVRGSAIDKMVAVSMDSIVGTFVEVHCS